MNIYKFILLAFFLLMMVVNGVKQEGVRRAVISLVCAGLMVCAVLA